MGSLSAKIYAKTSQVWMDGLLEQSRRLYII